METLKIFKGYGNKKISDFPEIVYSNLYKKVLNNLHYEFVLKEKKYLLSPYYTLLKGDSLPELKEFVEQNEDFLDSLKKYIINSLFIYNAIIEENSYYLTNPQSIVINRMIFIKDTNFVIKFYTHYEDELLNSYTDKIYIGRDFLNLNQFERQHLGLRETFISLIEQNKKMQERAKQKLRYFNDYKKPYLNEIEYLINEAVAESTERIKLFPETKLADITSVKLNEVLDCILYVLNLLIELRDFTQEFENKLRLREEKNFVKYVTKFSKDVTNNIRYLRKLSSQIHLRISNFPIS